MADKWGTLLRAAMAFFLAACYVSADEAVEYSGRKHSGRLQQDKDKWLFQNNQGKRLSLGELSYIRFEAKPTPAPRAPLLQALVLPTQQRISGTLQRFDDRQITFLASWGQTISLRREQVLGIEQGRDALPIVHDDFEKPLKSWRIDGKAGLSQEQAFSGKSSLLLDQKGQSAVREWQPPVRDGSIQLFFNNPTPASNLRWTLDIIPQTAPGPIPTLVIDRDGYACTNMKERYSPWKGARGWHQFSADIEAGRLRIFVDDHCLGQTTLPAKEALKGIRIAVSAADARVPENGKLWLDEILVTRRLPPLKRPQTVKDQDMTWLEHGEQLFGQIVRGDAEAVLLDAKFGKRSLAWSQLRGIYFARRDIEPISADPEITFRPGPGFPVDSVRAKLVRWDGGNLFLQNGLLGEIALERERLDKIRFAAK